MAGSDWLKTTCNFYKRDARKPFSLVESLPRDSPYSIFVNGLPHAGTSHIQFCSGAVQVALHHFVDVTIYRPSLVTFSLFCSLTLSETVVMKMNVINIKVIGYWFIKTYCTCLLQAWNMRVDQSVKSSSFFILGVSSMKGQSKTKSIVRICQQSLCNLNFTQKLMTNFWKITNNMDPPCQILRKPGQETL